MGYGAIKKTRQTVVRTSAVLTTEYVAGNVVTHAGFTKLYLDCVFTIGSSTGFGFKIETSMDGVTYQLEHSTIRGATLSVWTPSYNEVQLETSTNPRLVVETIADYVKVSFIALTSAIDTLLEVVAHSA